TNILPPNISMCTGPQWVGGQQAGARSQAVLSDGARFLRSVQGQVNEWIRMPIELPVPHEQDVVVSAYLTGHAETPARLQVQELDPEQVVVREHEFHTEPGSVLQRVEVPFHAQSRTAALRVRAYNVLTLALPAVTLTGRSYPWAVGRGCLAAVIDVHGEDIQAAFESPTDYGRRSAYSFTVTRLGCAALRTSRRNTILSGAMSTQSTPW